MIQETLKKVAAGQDLTYDEAYASMDEIFSGQVPERQRLDISQRFI